VDLNPPQILVFWPRCGQKLIGDEELTSDCPPKVAESLHYSSGNPATNFFFGLDVTTNAFFSLGFLNMWKKKGKYGIFFSDVRKRSGFWEGMSRCEEEA
jgi:hypothetical protein